MNQRKRQQIDNEYLQDNVNLHKHPAVTYISLQLTELTIDPTEQEYGTI